MILGWLRGNGKEKLRKKMKELRKAMTLEEVRQKSRMIQDRLAKLTEYREAGAALFYSAKSNEAQTGEIIADAIRRKKHTLLPVTDANGKDLSVSEITNYPKSLAEGPFGIMEPRKKKPFPESEIDMVVVPGLAFDAEGYRIGYGTGYYDRLLARLKKERINIRKVGLAYDFQVVEKLPRKKHDQKMDMIITESRVIISK